MGGYRQMRTQLLFLMEETLRVCILLQDYSVEKFQVFSSDDDQKIIETIKERETILDTLVNLENRIDLILEEIDAFCSDNPLPPEFDVIRQKIQSVLSIVADLDIKAMKLIGLKMKKYKDETLKARNRKHLSAYIRTGFIPRSCSSYDYKK